MQERLDLERLEHAVRILRGNLFSGKNKTNQSDLLHRGVMVQISCQILASKSASASCGLKNFENYRYRSIGGMRGKAGL